jgi:hypothetical protein
MDRGRGLRLALAGALAALLALGVAACGAEEETTTIEGEEARIVVEGEPIELGDLRFNVAITRFLNPDDVEDAEYLEGLPEPAANEDYLAVFMTVQNEGDDDLELPSEEDVEIIDITGEVYHPIETESIFALDLGTTIPAGGEAPVDDTAAASGPVQGSFILFLIPKEAQENRPLEMEIDADDEVGVIELDL